MISITQKCWRIIAKTLRIFGFGGCIVDFQLSIILIGYYSVTRPHISNPACNWTVKLYWSFNPPIYGTAGENTFLLSAHWWFFIFFLLIVFGEIIRIYIVEPDQRKP
jgi:hypothetical protein